jgi:hypothetical protein
MPRNWQSALAILMPMLMLGTSCKDDSQSHTVIFEFDDEMRGKFTAYKAPLPDIKPDRPSAIRVAERNKPLLVLVPSGKDLRFQANYRGRALPFTTDQSKPSPLPAVLVLGQGTGGMLSDGWWIEMPPHSEFCLIIDAPRPDCFDDPKIEVDKAFVDNLVKLVPQAKRLPASSHSSKDAWWNR